MDRQCVVGRPSMHATQPDRGHSHPGCTDNVVHRMVADKPNIGRRLLDLSQRRIKNLGIRLFDPRGFGNHNR